VKASDEMYFPCCLAVLGAIPCEDPRSAHTPTTTSVTLSNPLTPSTSLTATKVSIQECSTINEETTTNNTETPKNENENVIETRHEKESESDVKIENLKLDAVSSRQMTYCVWGQGDKNPKTFSSLTPDIITAAKTQKSIFLRKFVLPSTQSVDDNDRKHRQNRGRNSNNRDDWNDDEGDVNAIEVEKKILLRVWLSLVLQLPDNSDNDNNSDMIDMSERKKQNDNIDKNNEDTDIDGKDKIIKIIDEKVTENDPINDDVTEKYEDKRRNNNNDNDINFDFNYCLRRFDLFSSQNKEINDQHRHEKYERNKIENEARNERNHDKREYSPRESGRTGRSDIHRDQDNDRPGRSNSHRDQDNGRDSYHDSDRGGNDQNRSSDVNNNRYRNNDYNSNCDNYNNINHNKNNSYDNDNDNNYNSNRHNNSRRNNNNSYNYRHNNNYNNNYNDRDYNRNDDRNRDRHRDRDRDRDRDRQRNDEDNDSERNNADQIENSSNKKRKIADENALPVDSDVAVEVAIDGKDETAAAI
jgi:hypothetical protein